MEKVGKGAVMQADRDGRAGRCESGETDGEKRRRQRDTGRQTEWKGALREREATVKGRKHLK